MYGLVNMSTMNFNTTLQKKSKVLNLDKVVMAIGTCSGLNMALVQIRGLTVVCGDYRLSTNQLTQTW